MTMGIVSLNVGKPVTVDYQGKDLSTGIYKRPVEGPLFLSSLNFEGMVRPISSITAAWIRRCARTFEHYPYWEHSLGKQMAYRLWRKPDARGCWRIGSASGMYTG